MIQKNSPPVRCENAFAHDSAGDGDTQHKGFRFAAFPEPEYRLCETAEAPSVQSPNERCTLIVPVFFGTDSLPAAP